MLWGANISVTFDFPYRCDGGCVVVSTFQLDVYRVHCGRLLSGCLLEYAACVLWSSNGANRWMSAVQAPWVRMRPFLCPKRV